MVRLQLRAQARARTRLGGFTLIELLVVVAIIAILALIAVVNMREAIERALRSSDIANLHTIATGLQNYLVDYNTLPLADQEAGPFQSQFGQTSIRNAPAAGGSWDGVPWILIDMKYIGKWEALFCPKYLRLYPRGNTLRGDYPRYHNFRYAYNSSAMLSGGHAGGSGIMTGTQWLVRDLYLSAEHGWFADRYPDPPADYTYPWGSAHDSEMCLMPDMTVQWVYGGTKTPVDLSQEK